MKAVIVWAYGESNYYEIAHRDMVGVFTDFDAMIRALKEDGMTKEQFDEMGWFTTRPNTEGRR